MFSKPAVRRFLVAAVIAVIAWAVALLPRAIAPSGGGILQSTDEFFYDIYYRSRPVHSMQDAEVVIVTVDEESLNLIAKQMERGWPWPRQVWGKIASYLSDAGARAIVFDILFPQPSQYRSDGDDDAFAEELAKIKVPLVFGNFANPDGSYGPFAPKVDRPAFGATNVNQDKIYRRYNPIVYGRSSLAVAAVRAVGEEARLGTQETFPLHYYGPHQTKSGRTTFQFLPAGQVFGAAMNPAAAIGSPVGPDAFRGKIVLLGASAVGTYDLKASPLSPIYPGVEVQATAIENMLRGDQVTAVPAAWRYMTPLLAAMLVTLGVIFPRRATLKVLAPVLAVAAIVGAGVLLFRGPDIRWFAPTDALLAVTLATPVAFAWTYFAEDRQRRFMLKALSKVVSPAVAEQLAQNPERLVLGTLRTDLTVIFTDLANFTDLAETMDVQTLGTLLNRYLGEMSDQVLQHDGTLDKYIGDAVMCFWNAPLPQANHAVQACRAALAMARREKEISAELEGRTGRKIYTRIGINTTSAAVALSDRPTCSTTRHWAMG